MKKYFWNVIKNHYFEFEGRATVKEFWAFHGFYLLIFIPLCLIAPLAILFFFAIILPSNAIFVRRLHDVGLSGWWWLPAFLLGIPVLVISLIPSQERDNKYGKYEKTV